MDVQNNIFFEQLVAMLGRGIPVTFLVRGNSMRPFLRDRVHRVRVKPVGYSNVKCGDIILFRYLGEFVLHRVVKIKNGIITAQGDGVVGSQEFPKIEEIFGIVDAVISPAGKTLDYNALHWKLLWVIWRALGSGRAILLKIGNYLPKLNL